MQPNSKFTNLGKDFWANIKSISQHAGYTIRGQDKIKVPDVNDIKNTLVTLDLSYSHLIQNDNQLTELGSLIVDYYKYRAEILNNYVERLLMDVEEAKNIYENLKNKYNPKSFQPFNKQKGEKKSPAYLTCIVNMLINEGLNGLECNYNPNKLTTITRDGFPLRTLSRRVDGAFPTIVNPISIWEIKEYYYTTTFGSRVADGVYETLLDGMELEELYKSENIDIKHYLIIDSHYTWWVCGKAYLCRIIDMLHMGYVDEVIFGKEVIESLPRIIKEWILAYNSRKTLAM